MEKELLKSEDDFKLLISTLEAIYNPRAVMFSHIAKYPPKSYPCIAIYDAQDIDNYGGWSISCSFVYPSDFEKS